MDNLTVQTAVPCGGMPCRYPSLASEQTTVWGSRTTTASSTATAAGAAAAQSPFRQDRLQPLSSRHPVTTFENLKDLHRASQAGVQRDWSLASVGRSKDVGLSTHFSANQPDSQLISLSIRELMQSSGELIDRFRVEQTHEMGKMRARLGSCRRDGELRCGRPWDRSRDRTATL